MWRIALLGFVVLLPGCAYVGNPFDGFGGFLADTTNYRLNPNRPMVDSVNLHRAMGQQVDVAPLLPEAGNVWPGPPKPDPTLQDIEREQNNPSAQPLTTPDGRSAPGAAVSTQLPVAPHPQPRGSSTPPGDAPVPPPATIAAPPARSLAPPQSAAPGAGVAQTSAGQAVISNGANGIQQFTMPNGATGRAITNGNGTTTLIGPDGAVQSVPTPR